MTAQLRHARVSLGETFEGEVGALAPRPAVVGLPLGAFFIKAWALPPLEEGDKPEEAARLQAAFHLPWPQEESWFVHRLSAPGRGAQRVQMVATRRRELPQAQAVLPAPLGLFALAMALGLLEEGRNVALFHRCGDTVSCVTATGLEPAYLREMPAADLPGQARISVQAVYSRTERELVDPDRVVALGDEQLRDTLEAVFPGRVTHLPPQEALGTDAGGNAAQLVLPAGLALATARWGLGKRLRAPLAPWNVLPGRHGSGAALRRRSPWALPLLALLGTGGLYADRAANDARLLETRAAVEALRPQMLKVQEAEDAIVALRAFLGGAGRDMRSVGTWFALLEALESTRPVGVRVSNLSGKLDGLVLVSAYAPDYEAMTTYLAELGKAAGVREVGLVSSQQSEGKGVDFQLALRLPAGAAP